MAIKFIVLSFLLILQSTFASSNRIQLHGKDYFLNGMNIAWNNFGGDLTRYDSSVFEGVFANLAAAGGNSARWFMHCDGVETPDYDPQGKVTGLPEKAFLNLDMMLRQSARHGIMIMPVLFSFDIAKTGHGKLVTDTSYTDSYIRTVLDPMVRRYRGNPGLLAWEIINEPEWLTPGEGNSEIKEKATVLQVQRFVGRMASAIHRADPQALATVGSACLKWNSISSIATGNYYTDASLRSATGDDASAHLDFYQIHYYEWMHGSWGTFSPWDHGFPFWKLDKPLLIGEAAAAGESGYLTPMQMHIGAVDSGYAGIMTWAYLDNRHDAYGKFDDAKPGLAAVKAMIPEAVAVPPASLSPWRSATERLGYRSVTVPEMGLGIRIDGLPLRAASPSLTDLSGRRWK